MKTDSVTENQPSGGIARFTFEKKEDGRWHCEQTGRSMSQELWDRCPDNYIRYIILGCYDDIRDYI